MGKRFSAAAYDLPPASQLRCKDFLRACGIYVVLCMERAKGIEPSTYSLGSCRSTTELRPRSQGPTLEDNRNARRGKAAGPAEDLKARCAHLRTPRSSCGGERSRRGSPRVIQCDSLGGEPDARRRAKHAQFLSLLVPRLRAARRRSLGAGTEPLLLPRSAGPAGGGISARRS